MCVRLPPTCLGRTTCLLFTVQHFPFQVQSKGGGGVPLLDLNDLLVVLDDILRGGKGWYLHCKVNANLMQSCEVQLSNQVGNKLAHYREVPG